MEERRTNNQKLTDYRTMAQIGIASLSVGQEIYRLPVLVAQRNEQLAS